MSNISNYNPLLQGGEMSRDTKITRKIKLVQILETNPLRSSANAVQRRRCDYPSDAERR